MARHALVSALLFLAGVVIGHLLAGAPAQPSGTATPSGPAAREPQAPSLSGSGGADLAALEEQLAQRDRLIEDLQRRLEEAAAASRESEDLRNLDLLEGDRGALLSQYVDPGLSQEELLKKAASFSGYTSAFHSLVVGLHDRDVRNYLDAAWTARQAQIERAGVALTPDEADALGRIFRERWLGFREWARSEHLPALQAARTQEELRAATRSYSEHVSTTLAGIAGDAQRALANTSKPGLYERLAPFL